MTKKKVSNKSTLVAFLIIVPILVMWFMGFDNYDANEFSIIRIAVLADLVVYIGYKFLLPKLSR